MICLAPDPQTAWRLSGEAPWTSNGEWCLWQVTLPDSVNIRTRVDDGKIVEYLVPNSIAPERVWLVGYRSKGA